MHAEVDKFLWQINADSITPVFQPIVDLFKGSILGYEALSRGPMGMEAPAELFARAKVLGLTWELESACRRASLSRIATFERMNCQWFLNVSPEVFPDPRFDSRTFAAEVRRAGIESRAVVLEITERHSISDVPAFQKAIHAYSEQGFMIALDDFGSGHSGLIALIACAPHVIKLDMEIARDVNLHSYKQTIVRSLVSLASEVNARLIAEGVESWQELEMLVRQGVRFAQGRLFGSPVAEPQPLVDNVRKELLSMMANCSPVESNVRETVSRLTFASPPVERGTMLVQDLERLFAERPLMDCAVVVDADKPVGLITRAHLAAVTSGRFGYSLVQHKLVELIAKPVRLSVNRSASVVRLATLAMERDENDLYDPIVIVDDDGGYRGTVAIRQVILRSAELELQNARESNPLTLLPGNQRIQSWLEKTLQNGGTVIYADLDFFKEFNDAFGFMLGDEVIRSVGQTLVRLAHELSAEADVGHIGGDDFVVVVPGEVSSDWLDKVCATFDRERTEFFDDETRRRGTFTSENRQGAIVQVPITTMSLAVIPSQRLGPAPHPALLSQVAASLKRKAKQLSRVNRRSSYAIEMREHTREEMDAIAAKRVV